MGRARNIKPGFFVNEDLVELDFPTRLLFIGLWTEADKAGRLEDRPKKIKIAVFPADNVDIDSMLTALAHSGFIHRYEVAGKHYIQISNWDKHQNPHHTEKESVIPSMDNADVTVSSPLNNSDTTENNQNKNGGNPADSLIPDSLIHSKPTNPNGLVVASPADDRHPCPHQEIIALYHEVLPMCPRVRDWTPARATQLRARWNEDERRQNLDWWRKYFEYVLTCDFLVGKTHKPFFADLEWLVKSSNFTKTREGKYENREAA